VAAEAHSRGRLHPNKPKPGLPGTPGLCHMGIVGSRTLAAPSDHDQKWRHMGISPGDEWGRMAMNGTPGGYPKMAMIRGQPGQVGKAKFLNQPTSKQWILRAG